MEFLSVYRHTLCWTSGYFRVNFEYVRKKHSRVKNQKPFLENSFNKILLTGFIKWPRNY